MKILIVDDSRVARASIKRLLSALVQIEFFEADDGLAALKVIEAENPEIIFTDWYMEGMNGLELIKEVRLSKKTVKICMITSETNEEKKAMVMESGADYILNKPFQNHELAIAFEKMVG